MHPHPLPLRKKKSKKEKSSAATLTGTKVHTTCNKYRSWSNQKVLLIEVKWKSILSKQHNTPLPTCLHPHNLAAKQQPPRSLLSHDTQHWQSKQQTWLHKSQLLLESKQHKTPTTGRSGWEKWDSARQQQTIVAFVSKHTRQRPQRSAFLLHPIDCAFPTHIDIIFSLLLLQ